MAILATSETLYAVTKALYHGTPAVTTEDSEKLFFTTRIANAILTLRSEHKLDIQTKMIITNTKKHFGVYSLTSGQNDKVIPLINLFRDKTIIKYQGNLELLKMYLGDDYKLAA